MCTAPFIEEEDDDTSPVNGSFLREFFVWNKFVLVQIFEALADFLVWESFEEDLEHVQGRLFIRVADIKSVEQLDNVVVAVLEPGRNQLPFNDCTNRLGPIIQASLQDFLSLRNLQRFDVHFFGNKLEGCFPDGIVGVLGTPQNVVQGDPGGSNDLDDGSTNDGRGVVGQVKHKGLDDRAFFVGGILEPLESRDGLAADVGHFVLHPLEHVVINLLVEIVIDRGIFAHQLQELVDHEADSESGLRSLDLMMIQKPTEKLAHERREFGGLFLLFLRFGFILIVVLGRFFFLVLEEGGGKFASHFQATFHIRGPLFERQREL